MGYYIQAPTNRGKADYLVKSHGAEIVGRDNQVPAWSDEEAIVCVVDNGAFEAAGYAYSPDELNAFARPDRGEQRRHIWLKMSKTLARSLSGYHRND